MYNPGERVEGYSNLLWTLLLAALLAAGLEPLRAAELPGLLAYLWLAVSLAWASLRRAREARGAFLPLAAGFVLVSEDFQVWATGGLETMLFTALAVQALLLTRADAAAPARSLAAGGLLAPLALTRPDGLLFALAAAASWWLPPGRLAASDRRRQALLTLLPRMVDLHRPQIYAFPCYSRELRGIVTRIVRVGGEEAVEVNGRRVTAYRISDRETVLGPDTHSFVDAGGRLLKAVRGQEVILPITKQTAERMFKGMRERLRPSPARRAATRPTSAPAER